MRRLGGVDEFIAVIESTGIAMGWKVGRVASYVGSDVWYELWAEHCRLNRNCSSSDNRENKKSGELKLRILGAKTTRITIIIRWECYVFQKPLYSRRQIPALHISANRYAREIKIGVGYDLHRNRCGLTSKRGGGAKNNQARYLTRVNGLSCYINVWLIPYRQIQMRWKMGKIGGRTASHGSKWRRRVCYCS